MAELLPLLPHVNAALNAASAACLLAGYRFIRQRRIRAHLACMSSAFAFSILFLVFYLLYHAQVGSVRFQGGGLLRRFYFAVLISHTVLAVAVPPLAARTLYLAWKSWPGGDFLRHSRTARVTFPIWLYVSVTGVAVYLMLYWI